MSLNASPMAYNGEPESAPQSPVQKKRKKSNKSSGSKKGKLGQHDLALTNSSLVNYGQVSDVELINTYYEYIHLRFPIIPVNKETLTNEILLVNTQPVSELHEFNAYILLWFRNSLELLIRICRKDKQSEEVLYQQTTFVGAINECFQKIVDVHPRFRDLESQISEKIALIYLVTFIILNYTLALVSYNNSFVLGMSVIIFNELKLWKSFIFGNWDTTSAQEKMYLRLYYELNVFDSLQSCSFGVPKLMDLQLDENTVSKLFYDDVSAEGSDKEALKYCVDWDPENVAVIVDNMELGYFLTRLCQSRRSRLNLPLPDVLEKDKNAQRKTIPGLFRTFLYLKRQFTDLLLGLPDSEGKFPEMTSELVTKLSNMVCDLTSSIYDLLKLNLETNLTNCIQPQSQQQSPKDRLSSKNTISPRSNAMSPKAADVGGPSNSGSASASPGPGTVPSHNAEIGTVSPYIIAIFREVSNVVELIKNMPTSLIGCVIGTHTPNFDSQPLVLQLSQCMNNMLQIATFTSSLRPFKIFKYDPNDQTKNNSLAAVPIYKSKIQDSLPTLQTAVTPQQIMMTQFIETAWRLADTEELGWFASNADQDLV